MKLIKEEFLKDPFFEIWKLGEHNYYTENTLINKIEDIPDEYVVDIATCGECSDWDNSWTSDDSVGYCPMTDTFWERNEYCSRLELNNTDEQ